MLEKSANMLIPEVSIPQLTENVNERHIYYRLGESELFQYANKNTVINGVKLIDLIPRMTVPGNGFLHFTLDQFEKTTKYDIFESSRFKLTCKKELINILSGSHVVMVYSDEYKLPTSIPYIVQGTGPNATVFVNISDFVDIDQYGQVTVTQVRNGNGLMAVLFAAAVTYCIVAKNNALPADLSDGMILMYAAMLEKVINYIVHLDPITRDKVKYLASEFALVQMYGTEVGTKMFQRFKQSYFPKLSKMITDSIDNNFQIDSFDNITFFIEELKRLYPSMKGLSMYIVYDRWIRMYGASTAMSIDYFGYHLYTICMVLFESPLVTRMALEPLLEKSRGSDMYKRLQLMISTID